MVDELTIQDKTFVKEVLKTGNKTKAVKKAYGITDENYAGVKGNRMIRKSKIQKAIKSIADALPDDELIKVHKEGLKAGKHIYKNNNESGEVEDMGVEPDYATRHKYLDSAYKIKGAYAPDKNLNLNVNLNEGLTLEEQIKVRALLNGNTSSTRENDFGNSTRAPFSGK